MEKQIWFGNNEITIDKNKHKSAFNILKNSSMNASKKKIFKFQENNVYHFNENKNGEKKMCCFIANDEYAVLCPIVNHKKDDGYNLKLHKAVVYSNIVIVFEPNVIGSISKGVYISAEG